MDRLVSMAMFVRVVDKGSLAAAAEEFCTSATMVGKHLRALEEHLGGRLLNRTTRRQSLTDLGREYYDRCKRILADVEAADGIADAMHAAPRGVLRVSAPSSFGNHALIAALPDFFERYPEVAIDLSLDNRIVDLVEERFEVAIRIGALPDSNLVARPLADYRMVVCASPGYLARHGVPERLADLSGHDCLGFSHWKIRDEWHLEGPQGRETVRVRGRFQANSGQALRMAALLGLGIVMQPEVLLAEDLGAGRLVQVLPDYATFARPMHVVYHADRYSNPKLRCFVDFVVERFGRAA